ncbi:MAG: hypothetical protein WCG35_08660 [Betaproteobacteria bacterium]
MRELENVLERAAIVCGGNTISTQHLPVDMPSQNDTATSLTSTSLLPTPPSKRSHCQMQCKRLSKPMTTKVVQPSCCMYASTPYSTN